MRIAARERAKNAVTLTLARAKDERAAQSAVKGLLKEMGVSPKDIAVQLDESLIGGWRLEGRERLVDASFKKDLLSLYNRVTL
jgi:F0F1-type ATP synthase delta subunit